MQNPNYFQTNPKQRLLGGITFVSYFIVPYIYLLFFALIIAVPLLIVGTAFYIPSVALQDIFYNALLLYGQVFILLLLATIIYIMFSRELHKEFLAFFKTKNFLIIIFGVIIIYVSVTLYSLASVAIQNIFQIEPYTPENQNILEQILVNASFVGRIFFVFQVVILAPIVEELIFRFVLMKKILSVKSVAIMLLVPAVIFAGIHVSSEFWELLGSIFSGQIDVIFLNMVKFISLFLDYFPLAIILGAIYYYSKNIYVSIGVHMLYNLIATVLIFFTI